MASEVASLVERFLSPQALAERWDMDDGTLANWRVAGTGPIYVRIGGNIRYRIKDVIAWEDENTVHPIGA